MAYGDQTAQSGSVGTRVTDYGYGLDDIQRATEANQRSSIFNKFNVEKNIQNAARSLGGTFNRRGMVDSGLHRRGIERGAAQAELSRFGLARQAEEAGRQLDRQRQQIEEQFSGGVMNDQIANALRRFGITQTLEGLI